MQVSLVGISHRTAPVSLRERFAFTADDMGGALRLLGNAFGGAAILSTCNRTELYVATPHRRPKEALVEALASVRGADIPEGLDFYHHAGHDAVDHLFRVAAGLDSLVLGEYEILGQVRRTFTAATAAQSSNAALARLFHSAIRVGRRARSETDIGRREVSVSSTAVALVRNTLGDLTRRTVLVVGAGEAGGLICRALVQAGASRVLVTTRTYDRAGLLAAEMGGLAVPFEDRYAALAEADVAITSTSAPGHVLSEDEVSKSLARRGGRPLVIVDIAVPRDVEPTVGNMPGVRLFDIDTLQSAAEANLELRRQEVTSVEWIVGEESRRFQAWLRGLGAVPTVRAINEKAEAARLVELERTLTRLSGLGEAEKRQIEIMTKALVKRLLHNPVTRLRDENVDPAQIEAARHLFGVEE